MLQGFSRLEPTACRVPSGRYGGVDPPVAVRSTRWSLLAATALMLSIDVAASADHPGDPAPIWFAAEFAILPGQFGFLLMALNRVGCTYSVPALTCSSWRSPTERSELLRTLAVDAVSIAVLP